MRVKHGIFYQHSIMMAMLSVDMIYHRSIYSGAFKRVCKVNWYCVIVSGVFICKFNYISGLLESTALIFFKTCEKLKQSTNGIS